MVEHEAHAGGRPRQLRQHRRRRTCGHAIHRGAPCAARRGNAPRHRCRYRRLPAELRQLQARACGASHTLPQPAGERCFGHRRGHGHKHAHTQSDRLHQRIGGSDRQSRPERRGTGKNNRGSRLPHLGRHHLRLRRRDGGIYNRPRTHPHPRQSRNRDQRRTRTHSGARDSLWCKPRRAYQEHSRPCNRQAHRGNIQHQRRVRPRRHANSDPPALRCQRPGGAQQALQAHSHAELVQREQCSARRRAPRH